MLRIPYAKTIGIAGLLLVGTPLIGFADDAAPRGKATTPPQMGCRDYANAFASHSGNTTPKFSVSAYSLTVTPKSKTEFCATTDVTKLTVSKDVTSTYWIWAVTDAEKACEAAATARNTAMKGFEQEHIGDAAAVATAQTAKLRDAVKGQLPACAASGADAQTALKKIVDGAEKTALADTLSEWSKAVQKRDGSGSHTYKTDCSCAP